MVLKSSALADTGQRSLLRLSLLILSWIIPLFLLFCLQSRDILHLRMTWGPPPGLSLRIWGTKAVFGRTALWGWGVERWYHNQAIPDSSRTTGSTGKGRSHSLPTLSHRAPSSHRRGPGISVPLTSCPHKTVCQEVGGGIGMGNTCKPMAFSFQCMTKFTTKKKNNKEQQQKKPHILCSRHLQALCKSNILLFPRFIFQVAESFPCLKAFCGSCLPCLVLASQVPLRHSQRELPVAHRRSPHGLLSWLVPPTSRHCWSCHCLAFVVGITMPVQKILLRSPNLMCDG